MSFVKLTPATKLVKIATRKRRGDVVEVADDLWLSPSHVSNVLAGRRNNLAVTNKMYRKVYRREPAMA